MMCAEKPRFFVCKSSHGSNVDRIIRMCLIRTAI